MELTIEQALQKGIEAHKVGQIQEADRMYTAILKAQPQHPDANHNLGVLAVQLGKVEQALPFFEKALQANDKVEQFWLSHLDALIKLGRTEEAEKKLDQARWQGFQKEKLSQLEAQLKSQQERAPQTIEQALQKGIEAHKAGKLTEADQMYTAILQIQPQHPDANHNLGVLAVQLGKVEQALPFFEKALQANDQMEQYWLSYLDALLKLGRTKEMQEGINQARQRDFNSAH